MVHLFSVIIQLAIYFSSGTIHKKEKVFCNPCSKVFIIAWIERLEILPDSLNMMELVVMYLEYCITFFITQSGTVDALHVYKICMLSTAK